MDWLAGLALRGGGVGQRQVAREADDAGQPFGVAQAGHEGHGAALRDDPYYLQTGARLTVTQRLIGPVGLQGTAARQHLSYRWRRGVTPTPGFEHRNDQLDIFGAGVVVNIGQGLSVLVGAERAKRVSSEDPRQNFTRTRLLSAVTVGK